MWISVRHFKLIVTKTKYFPYSLGHPLSANSHPIPKPHLPYPSLPHRLAHLPVFQSQ